MRAFIYFIIGAANLAVAIDTGDPVSAFFGGALLAFALAEAAELD